MAIRRARHRNESMSDQMNTAHDSLQNWELEHAARLRAEEQLAALQKKVRMLESGEQRVQDAQRQLIHTEKMACLGQLAAGVAHEINNPVGFVLSNLDTLSGYLGSLRQVLSLHRQATHVLPADDPRRRAADALESEVELDYLLQDVPALLAESQEGLTRIRDIILDLRNFTRNDDGQHAYMNVNDCVEEAVRIARPRWKHHVEIETDLRPLPQVYGASGRILQVFVNLIVNAAQAISGGGWVRISTRADGAVVEARVTDTGSGIEPDKLEEIFSPFFTTKPAGEGTGLGLAVSSGIIERHAGTMSAESTLGQGSTFIVRIPIDHRQLDAERQAD